MNKFKLLLFFITMLHQSHITQASNPLNYMDLYGSNDCPYEGFSFDLLDFSDYSDEAPLPEYDQHIETPTGAIYGVDCFGDLKIIQEAVIISTVNKNNRTIITFDNGNKFIIEHKTNQRSIQLLEYNVRCAIPEKLQPFFDFK